MAGIYNPWANPETDETLAGMFATPDLMATGNPRSGGNADMGEIEMASAHESGDPAIDATEDANDPTEESELDDSGEASGGDQQMQAHMNMMSQAMSVIQSQNSVITQLLATLTSKP